MPHLESVTKPKQVGGKVRGVGGRGGEHPLHTVALGQSAQCHHLLRTVNSWSLFGGGNVHIIYGATSQNIWAWHSVLHMAGPRDAILLRKGRSVVDGESNEFSNESSVSRFRRLERK